MRLLGVVVATAVLLAAGLAGAGWATHESVTEFHVWSTQVPNPPGRGGMVTVSGTITDADPLPHPVTVTAPPATTEEPPPPPPPPAGDASLFLSPSGSDAWACSLEMPCRSFARAYELALPDAVVSVGAGVYPAQNFAGGYQAVQPQGSKHVTFRGESGNAVRQLHSGSPNIIYDGVVVDAGGAQTVGAAFENGGANGVVFRDGSIGNVVDEKGALVGGDILFDNVRFHDVVIRTSGVHSECIFAAVPEGMIVRDSTFVNCAVMDIFFVWPDWWSPAPPAYGHVVLERNVFGDPVGSCCGIYVGGTGPNGDRAMRDWVVRGNRFDDPPATGASVGGVYCGNTGAAPEAWKVPC